MVTMLLPIMQALLPACLPQFRRHTSRVVLLWQQCFTRLAAPHNAGSQFSMLQGAATCSHCLKCEVQPAAACRPSGGFGKEESQQGS